MTNNLLHCTLSIGMWLAFSMLSNSQVLIENPLKKFEATTTSEGLEILEYVRTITPYKDGVVYSSRLLQQYASFDEDFEAFSTLIDYDYCKVVRRDSVMNIVATWHASDTDSPTKRYRSVTSIWEEGDYIKAYGSGTNTALTDTTFSYFVITFDSMLQVISENWFLSPVQGADVINPFTCINNRHNIIYYTQKYVKSPQSQADTAVYTIFEFDQQGNLLHENDTLGSVSTPLQLPNGMYIVGPDHVLDTSFQKVGSISLVSNNYHTLIDSSRFLTVTLADSFAIGPLPPFIIGYYPGAQIVTHAINQPVQLSPIFGHGDTYSDFSFTYNNLPAYSAKDTNNIYIGRVKYQFYDTSQVYIDNVTIQGDVNWSYTFIDDDPDLFRLEATNVVTLANGNCLFLAIRAYTYVEYSTLTYDVYYALIDKNGDFITSSVNTPESLTKKLEYFPNPTNNIITISNLTKPNAAYQISNALGQVVQQGKLQSDNTLSVAALAKGIYFINIEGHAPIKVVKE